MDAKPGAASKRVVRVCLYGAISSAEENQPVAISLPGRTKRSLARAADIASWFLLKRSGVRFNHWQSVLNTNKGDIAIRETIKAQLREALAPHDVEFSELKWGQLKPHMIDGLNRSCDLFVIGGSGYIRPRDNGELPADMVEDAEVFSRLACVKVAYGIGWNSLLNQEGAPKQPFSPSGQKNLSDLLKALDLISVRDRTTHGLVQDVSGKPPVLVGDPALFYSDLFAETKARRPKAKLQVGLNMAIHGSTSVRRIGQQFDKYCAFLKSLSREHNLTYHYVQHTHTERVIPLLLASRGISVVRHDPPASRLPDFYRGLDIHICQMMHSSVLSTGVGVPTLNFGYDIKNVGFFDVMGLNDFNFSAWDFDQNAAVATAGRMITDRAAISQAILKRKEELRAELNAFLRSIRASLDTGASDA